MKQCKHPPNICNKCFIHSCRLHKHLEMIAPLMNQGFTLRLFSTNWNRLDVAAIDFGGTGRCSEVLPAYNMAETSALKTITAAPGNFYNSKLREGKLNRGYLGVADTVLNIWPPCQVYQMKRKYVSKATAVVIQKI